MHKKAKPSVKTDFDLQQYVVNSEILKSHYRSILRCIQHINFNVDNPENMNLKYDPDFPDSLFIIKNNEWICNQKDFILDSIILDIWQKLNTYYLKIIEDEESKEDYIETLTCEDTFERIESFMNDFTNFCNKGDNMCILDQKKLIFESIQILSKKFKL